jgi:hypothetical protein
MNQADEEKHEEFLQEIADEVDMMLCGTLNWNDKKVDVDSEAVKARFEDHTKTFGEEYKEYCESEEKARRQRREDYERIQQNRRYRDKTKKPQRELVWSDDFYLPAEYVNPGTIEDEFVVDEPVAGWVRLAKPRKHDPTKWPEYHNDVFADIQMSCYYVTTAVIFNYKKGRMPLCDSVWNGCAKIS